MSVQLQSHPSERRKVARQKSFLRGMIQFNNRRSVLDCLIRDISPYGARLVFSETPSIPDVLELNIPQKEKTLRVHVIWRHDKEVGVAFAQITELEQSTESSDLAERVTRLEAEVAGLKRALRKLRSDGIQDLDTD